METGKPGVASGKGSLICLSGAEGSGKTTMISAVSEKVSAFAQNRCLLMETLLLWFRFVGKKNIAENTKRNWKEP